jgi:hypothetical protein
VPDLYEAEVPVEEIGYYTNLCATARVVRRAGLRSRGCST